LVRVRCTYLYGRALHVFSSVLGGFAPWNVDNGPLGYTWPRGGLARVWGVQPYVRQSYGSQLVVLFGLSSKGGGKAPRITWICASGWGCGLGWDHPRLGLVRVAQHPFPTPRSSRDARPWMRDQAIGTFRPTWGPPRAWITLKIVLGGRGGLGATAAPYGTGFQNVWVRFHYGSMLVILLEYGCIWSKRRQLLEGARKLLDLWTIITAPFRAMTACKPHRCTRRTCLYVLTSFGGDQS